MIDELPVSEELEKEHFVAIKIEANSITHTQFKQICILTKQRYNVKRVQDLLL